MLSTALSHNRSLSTTLSGAKVHLALLERLVLAVGIIEIPLGIDKYLKYDEENAAWGALGGFTVSVTTFCLVFLYLRWMFSVVRRELQPKPIMFGHLSSGGVAERPGC